MWAIERTENNLRDTHKVLRELSNNRYEARYAQKNEMYQCEVLKCLVQIARNLADISDGMSEMNGYDLGDEHEDIKD